MPIFRLENIIQTYAWGSMNAIAELLGKPSPSREPQAELWLGTHPKGPSMVVTDDERIPLNQLIQRQPVDILGPYAAMHFDNALPYLLKVLAAAQPLSIQAHPGKGQAAEGFARENRAGKALDAPDRNYRDANHKPEIICALTPFWGLNGFRSAAEAVDLLAPVCPLDLKDALQDLRNLPASGLQRFFEAMMTLPGDKRQAAAKEILNKAISLADSSAVYRWMVDLARAYPGDMGVLSPALLNLICLEPGQAMYLSAGQLHAYLDGVGIELMANSDNVLRGGLTPKHVDVPELLKVVRFEEGTVKMVTPESVRPSESVYTCPATEFILSVIRPTQPEAYISPSIRSAEILICTAGEGQIDEGGSQTGLSVKKGDSFLVPASLDCYTIQGNCVFYKAAVPLPESELKAS